MTVRISRTFDVEASPAAVWAFIADPANRANAISVVESWHRDGDEFVWNLTLPIPLIDRTVAVRTRDVEREENERVQFVGRSRVMHVTGEHILTSTNGTTRVENRFVVEGRLPGVERFFDRSLGDEFDNLRRALEESLEARVGSGGRVRCSSG